MSKQSKIISYSDNWKDYTEGERFKTHSWRKQILERDNHRCRQCYNTIIDPYRKLKPGMEVHHIIPRRHGGRNTLKNGITLCTFCHSYYGELYKRYGMEYLKILELIPKDLRLTAVRDKLLDSYIKKLKKIIEE